MKRLLFLLNALAITFISLAQTPELVKNINTQDQGTGLSSDNAVMGSNFYFGSGKQVWKTDGTPAGTLLIKDFSDQNAVSLARFIATGNAVYFMVSLPASYELWTTDGSESGTVSLKNFGTNQPLFYRAAIGNTVFFAVTEGSNGNELWKSDGTVAGTVIVKDINPGSANSNPSTMKNINGTLFFCATTSTGTGLWKSDGSEAGTTLITDLDAASNSYANSGEIITFGSKALFYFESSAAGRELWISDGTAAGTFMLIDINAGTAGSFPNNVTALGSKVCFVAQDAINRQVWVTDGTTAGTSPLFDAVPASKNDSYTYFTNCNGTLYFSVATSIVSSTEPYISDGTPAGTMQLQDVNPGASGSDSRGYKYFNGRTYFIARTATTGYELWSSDGTTANTNLFTEIFPGTDNGIGGSYLIEAVVNNHIIFSGNHPSYREEPYSSDGTVAGTQLLKNIQTLGLGSYPKYITPIGNRLYFSGTLGFSDIEPWDSDGTESGTQLFKDVEPGTAYSQPFEFLNIDNNSFYFRAYNSSSERSIYKSDGTAVGTVKIAVEIQSDRIRIANNILFFGKRDATNGTELWKYESSTASLVKNINPAAANSFPSNITTFNNQAFFFADDGTNGNELWKSDGTEIGTQMVTDINPGINSSGTYTDMAVYNGNLYFYAIKNNALSLMKTDGTAAGTVEVKIFTGNDGPGNLFVSGSSLFFIKKNENVSSQINTELWKTDGTEAGTQLLTELIPYTSTSSDYIQTHSFFTNGSRFYFYTDLENLFGETLQLTLWSSDGTVAGTVAVKTYSFPPGDEPNIDDGFSYIASYDDDEVIFVFADAANDFELWRTNGTIAGTSLATDLNPGTEGSYPSGLVNFNGAIYFSARNETDQNELWKMNMGSVVPLKLLSFKVYKQNKTVQLLWHTVNEINSSHFVIERSANGRNFTAIGNVTAQGRNNNNYTITDGLPLNGNNFYRLRMFDKNGTFVFSDVIKIEFNLNNIVTISPNPAHDFIVIKYGEQFNRLRILDINGKQIMQFEKRTDNRYNITGLSKGMYLVQLSNGEEMETRKIVIE